MAREGDIEAVMSRTVRVLSISALLLLSAGWAVYHLGSQLNRKVANYDEMLWDQAPGDKWLYVGGLMMLISGALAAAAVRLWRESRREIAGSSLGTHDH